LIVARDAIAARAVLCTAKLKLLLLVKGEQGAVVLECGVDLAG